MAAPVFQAQGATVAATTGAPSITIPTHQANDIIIVAASYWGPATAGDAAQIPTPTNYTLLGVQVGQPAAADRDGWVAWFWRRVTAGGTTVTLTTGASWDSGTDTCYGARAYVIRGCITTGDPWDAQASAGPRTTANQAVAAVTVSAAERMVVQFGNSMDNAAFAMTSTRWTLGTEDDDAAGTDCAFQTARKDNVSSSTTADAMTVAAPAQGAYGFMGVSFKPPADVTVDATTTGVSRIQKTVDATTTGVSRVTATVDQTNLGVSRISATVDKTNLGVSRITATVDRTQTGVSRITATVDQTTTGVSRITTTVDKTQTGVANISTFTTVDATTTGKARIEKTVDQTQSGVSRIEKTVDQTQTGVTRIQQTVDSTQLGVARITATTDQTQTGLSRITATTDRTQTGVARIDFAKTYVKNLSLVEGELALPLAAIGNTLPITIMSTAPVNAPPTNKGVVFRVSGGVLTIYAWDGSAWIAN